MPVRRLSDVLRSAPATVPALGALVLFVVWAGDQAGYPVTHWAPGGLIVAALLAIALWSVPVHLRELPRPVVIALACLAAYTALSFLSILWAAVPGDAWEGADRTLLYLLVFALFALWPQRGPSAALLLSAWTLAMIGLAAYVALRVDTRTSLSWFADEGRLGYPAGYINASAAMWAMAMWPALLLASERRLPWALRGVFAGGTVLLALLALLSQSRGSLYATVVMLVLVFALLPNRLRTFAVLLAVTAGIGLATPAVLHVAERILHGGDAHAALHTAIGAIFAAAAVVGVIVAGGAALEGRTHLSSDGVRRVRTGLGALAIVVVVGVLAGGWIAAGNPISRARHAWETFKSPQGYAANGGGNRLTSGFGSSRYDFYRVSLDEFVDHPLVGIGADNFAQPYLARRRSDETPHYPHSVELRTLTQTGLVGALLAVAGLAAALLAGGRALRRADPLGRAVAGAALAGFVYWLVHGSFDWFWEFAGLGAPAFALLGIACALAPRTPARAGAAGPEPAEQGDPHGGRGRGRGRRRLWLVAGAVVAVAVLLVTLGGPWLSQLDVERAARVWPAAPASAYRYLDDAADLDPLSDEPFSVAGSIAVRLGDLTRAEREFSRALARTHGDAYATLELGAIASARGQRARALLLLERAAHLDPRDELTQEALSFVRHGGRIDLDQLNRSILLKAQRIM